MKENYLQSKVIKWLNNTYKDDIVVYNIHGNSFQKKGIPDLLICYKGRFIALELKQENGRLSEIQKYRIQKLINAGAVVEVPRTLKDVQEVFKQLVLD